jgi:leader peptidase (prepilin peptidase)/N-methyltransferase
LASIELLLQYECLSVIAVAAMFGLICGSFVTALSYRLPRGKDFVIGRSRCPSCSTYLSPRDLIPVLSWVISMGRCRHCKMAVSARYPVIELLCGALFVVVVVFQMPFELDRIILLWVLTVLLLALSVIDFEFRHFQNGLVLVLYGMAGVLAWLDQRSIIPILIAVAAVFSIGLCSRVLGQFLEKKPGLAWGDIKLGMALAIPIPMAQLLTFLIVFGFITLVLTIWVGLGKGKRHFPLGLALCAGAFAALL